MCGWSFTIINIILSSIILLVLKDLLANFIITCTLKDRRIAWLCLIEGHLASLHEWITLGARPCISSKHVLFKKALRKIQFPTWQAVFTASAQYLLGVLCSSSIV
jgi:hypothetical protein